MTRDEDLRQIVLEFRSSVSAKFAEQDARLDGIDGRLDGIDGRLDGIDGRLNGIDGRLNGIDERIQTMEVAILNAIRELSTSVHRRLDGHESRLGRLEG